MCCVISQTETVGQPLGVRSSVVVKTDYFVCLSFRPRVFTTPELFCVLRLLLTVNFSNSQSLVLSVYCDACVYQDQDGVRLIA